MQLNEFISAPGVMGGGGAGIDLSQQHPNQLYNSMSFDN